MSTRNLENIQWNERREWKIDNGQCHRTNVNTNKKFK